MARSDPLPLYDASAAIACTASVAELAQRAQTLERLRASMTSLERTDHGLLLRFPPDPVIEAELRRLAVDEKACCQFWGFEVGATPDVLTFRWDGPPSVEALLTRLTQFFEGDAPLTLDAGLL